MTVHGVSSLPSAARHGRDETDATAPSSRKPSAHRACGWRIALGALGLVWVGLVLLLAREFLVT